MILAACVAAIGIVGCSTDVELNAPYDSKTVVFGLLDPSLDTQWVKINRTWLGESNNIDVAGIRDSSEYPEGAFTAYLEEWNDGQLLGAYLINDTLLDNKEPGIFYAPEHTAYYAHTPGGLNTGSDYRLNIDFTSKEDVEATTDVIATPVGSVQYPFSPDVNPQFPGVNFAAVTPNGTIYYDQQFEWLASANATRYEASMRIFVTEYIYSSDQWENLVEVRERALDWVIGTDNAAPDAGPVTLSVEVSGQAFYRFLQNALVEDPNIRRSLGYYDSDMQETRVFDFIITMANEELDTYLDVNEPVTNIVQERPNYTNVVNGIGLFASRAQDVVRGVQLTTGSSLEAYQGEFTSGLNFCSPSPISDFYCGE